MLSIKEIIDFEVDFVHDEGKVVDAFNEVDLVNIDGKNASKIIVRDPVFVVLIKIL